jgi:hypothetical protein
MNKVERVASHQVFASRDQLALRGADGAMRPLSCTPAAAYYVITAAERAAQAAADAARVADRGRFTAAEERIAGFDQTVDSLSVLALSRARTGLMLGENA